MFKKSKIPLKAAAYSDIGNVRKANEDNYFVSPDKDLLIVCDGMGGQVAGGFASKIAVETVKDVYYGISKSQLQKLVQDLEVDLAESTARLVAAVRIANRRLYKIAASFPKLRGMGTTVVALALDEKLASMVHVGDSRIHRISGERILQLTEDHSWLNELIEDEEINEEQIETFQEKNVITRALGTSSRVKLDVHCEKYHKNDVYILSTDGMHNSVKAADIQKYYQRHFTTVDSFAKLLIEKAKKRDGTDNITVAAARVTKDCEESHYFGISTTVHEENERVAQKEDKFLQDNYGDPKSTLMKKQDVPEMKQNKLVVPALILLTGIVCFLLGMILQGGNPNSRANRARTDGTIQQNRSALAGSKNPGAATRQPTEYAKNNVLPIKRSEVRKDAVLAFVFFNSMEDYRNAMMEKRASVLDKIQPYAEENTTLGDNFSLFLIDSENNVIRKTSGLKLPAFEEASNAVVSNKVK